MNYIKDARTLTLAGGLAVLDAAIAEAERIGQPMCITVVDTGGNLLAFGRMDGSKALSVISTRNKAVTAALSNEPTGGAHADVELQVTLAQESKWTNLIGGIPIRVDGFVLGAVAAGSGTGTQDLAVARAGAAAIAGAEMFLDFKPMGAEDTGIIRGSASGEAAWMNGPHRPPRRASLRPRRSMLARSIAARRDLGARGGDVRRWRASRRMDGELFAFCTLAGAQALGDADAHRPASVAAARRSARWPACPSRSRT